MDSNNNATDYSMQTFLSASIAGLYYLSSLNLMDSFIAVCTGEGWQGWQRSYFILRQGSYFNLRPRPGVWSEDWV